MPEIVKQLRPLILGDLQPRLNITVVRDEAGLAELQAYIAHREHKQEIKQRRLQERISNPCSYMLRTKRNECKKFGIEFSLELSDLSPLPKVCPVLGLTLNYIVTSGRPEDNSPSIDRVNNSFGYVHGNVQVISNRANRLKSDGTREEHLKIAGYMEDSNA